MRNKSLVKNISYLVIILVFFSSGTLLLKNYELQLQQTFKPNLIYLTLINLISCGGIGVVLGLSNLNIGLKKEGKWKVDKTKLIIIGIPSFMVSMTFVWVLLGMKVRYIPNDYVMI